MSQRKEQYQAQVRSEVLRYRSLGQLSLVANPLAWWEKNQTTFPFLRELAQRVLCVPASSAASERLFSKAGLISTKLRNRLKGRRVAQVVTARGALAAGLLKNC